MSLRANLICVVLGLALIAGACSASTTIESTEAATDLATPEATPVEVIDEAAGGDGVRDELGEQPTPDPEPTDVEQVDTTETIDDLTASATEVILLDAGAEPRAELRLTIAASCGESTIIDQTQEITQTVDGLALPEAGALGTVVEMSTSAARVGDNYETQAEIIDAYASPSVAPGVAVGMNVELARLVGITTFVTITDRRVQVPGTVRVDGAEAFGPLQSALESVAQVQSPLPIEAVGVGARWQVTNVVEFEGADLMTVTEYLLTDRDGTLVTMQLDATQSVAAGSAMNMQGFEVEVIEWAHTTTGEVTMDLATISPIRSVRTTRATQLLDFGVEGVLLQEIQSDMSMTTEPNSGCTGRTTNS